MFRLEYTVVDLRSLGDTLTEHGVHMMYQGLGH